MSVMPLDHYHVVHVKTRMQRVEGIMIRLLFDFSLQHEITLHSTQNFIGEVVIANYIILD